MKFGVFGGAVAKRGDATADSQGYKGMLDMALEAEDLGFHSIFLVEHHFSGSGQISASLNLLTYIAALTKNMRLGTAVTVLPWHNPVLIAEQAATLDLLSGGRLDFGVGKGYRDVEFDAFCVPKEEALPRYEESVDLIVKSWVSEERFSHEGRFWNFKDIVVEPPCIQKPHPPLWTAAGTDESITRVAGTGFNLLLDHFGSPQRTKERLDVWRTACKQVDRPFNPMEVALARGMTITTSDAEYEAAVEQRLKRVSSMFKSYGALPGLEKKDGPVQPETYADANLAMEDAAIIGSPEQVAARVRQFRDMGFEYMLILFPDDIETLRIFAREIMPEFQESPAAVR